MVLRDELSNYINTLLNVEYYKDYGPNGLQVEGKAEIRKIVCGVTASLALIRQAVNLQADAVLVHHGLFWRGQDGRVVGWMKQRLQQLLAHDINLYAYHLPLDAAPDIGNNAVLGARLGLVADAYVGEQGIIALGHPQDTDGLTLEALAHKITHALNKPPVVVQGDGRLLRKLAWCTGGAQGYFETAIAAGADAYITGEISEPQMHYAQETGVAFLACGHHATERFGIQALTQKVADHFHLHYEYCEIDNPA